MASKDRTTWEHGEGVTAYGRVNHFRDQYLMNESLCGVELIRNPDSITAWSLCRKCEAIAERKADHG